ncbi:MAG: ACT domain-containing protein [Calditrichia bacterium]
MDKIQELFVILENRPKATAEVCRILKKKRIAIYAIGVFMDTARLYVSHPEKAEEVLKEYGYPVDSREVLRVNLPNRQGALMELTMKLGNAGINIEYLYGAMTEKQKRGTIIMEVDQPDLAIEIFKNHQF